MAEKNGEEWKAALPGAIGLDRRALDEVLDHFDLTYPTSFDAVAVTEGLAVAVLTRDPARNLEVRRAA